MSNIDQSLDTLRQAFNKLMNADPSQLDQDHKTKMALSIQKLSLIIRKLETAQIEGLTNELKAKLPQLQGATDDLQNKLDGLNRATDVVNVVSQFLDTTTGILQLFA